MNYSIDINADIGEHETDEIDKLIMPYIASCNIACGGHFGDQDSVDRTMHLAIKNKVSIGAHPSFPDKENFGRKVFSIPHDVLLNSLVEQISIIESSCKKNGVKMHHIKPHGALYNEGARNTELAEIICDAVLKANPKVPLYGLPNSYTEKIALKRGIPFIPEAFADRQYERDGSLRSRSLDNAVLSPEEAIKQVKELVLHQRVKTPQWISIKAKTICLHSDTKGSAALAKKIHETLVSNGISICSV